MCTIFVRAQTRRQQMTSIKACLLTWIHNDCRHSVPSMWSPSLRAKTTEGEYKP